MKRKWEGGAYHDIPFEQGIEVVLRDLCATKKLDWDSIQAKIHQLLKEEREARNKKTKQPKETSPSEKTKTETKPGLDLSELKKAEKGKKVLENKGKPKKERATPPGRLQVLQQIKEPPTKINNELLPDKAEKFWHEALPEAYRFETKTMIRSFATMYGLGKDAVLWILKKSIETADKNNEKELTTTKHIIPAIEELRKTLGLETLLRERYLKDEKKEKEALEKKKKTRPSWKAAPKYWAEALPKGFVYARGDSAPYLAKFCPGWSFGEMLRLLEEASKFAQADGTTRIAYTDHIMEAMYKLGIRPPAL